MIFFRVIRWIVWKDLLSEIRSRENISSMFFFALIIILIFSLSLSMDTEMVKEMIPGILWIAFSFTGIIGLGKSFLVETQNDCMENLLMAPIPKGAVYLGKLLGNFLFMLVVEIIIFPLFVIFFNLDIFGQIPMIMLICFLGTLGLAAMGTLLSAMTVQIKAREVMFPLMLLPLVVPVIIGAVEATKGAINADPLKLYQQWIQLLAVFDLVFLIVSYWLFEFILED
ncbi:MAG: heme exporter protein CcmB [Nitrospirae bacterium]|nr:heme exporter protein CcmB [Nitrospirota bacterium]